MSHPLSVSSHRGHLEPSTRRPSFTPTTNTVLAWHHRPCGRDQGRSLCAGASAPRFGSGRRQHWLRLGAKPHEQWFLRDSPLRQCFF